MVAQSDGCSWMPSAYSPASTGLPAKWTRHVYGGMHRGCIATSSIHDSFSGSRDEPSSWSCPIRPEGMQTRSRAPWPNRSRSLPSWERWSRIVPAAVTSSARTHICVRVMTITPASSTTRESKANRAEGCRWFAQPLGCFVRRRWAVQGAACRSIGNRSSDKPLRVRRVLTCT